MIAAHIRIIHNPQEREREREREKSSINVGPYESRPKSIKIFKAFSIFTFFIWNDIKKHGNFRLKYLSPLWRGLKDSRESWIMIDWRWSRINCILSFENGAPPVNVRHLKEYFKKNKFVIQNRVGSMLNWQYLQFDNFFKYLLLTNFHSTTALLQGSQTLKYKLKLDTWKIKNIVN